MLRDIINYDSDEFWKWWSEPLKSEIKEYHPLIYEVRNSASKRTRG